MSRIPYVLNIVILVPVVAALVWHSDGMRAVFGPGLEDSSKLRPLVASLWLGVLICSIIALRDPLPFWPLLLFQLVYKSVYLAFHVVPVLLRDGLAHVPWGVAASFAAIVCLWPYFLWQSLTASP